MKIGEVARRAGLAPSAIRYYEKAGLLRAPRRSSRQRSYDANVLGRLRMIRIARDAGFTIAETRMFLSGFPADTKPSVRWQALAVRKLAEIDRDIAALSQMKTVLADNFHCRCQSVEDCEEGLSLRRC